MQCKKDKPPSPSAACPGVDTSTITYRGYVSGIMQRYCMQCHAGSSPSAGIALETYEQVKQSAQSGIWYQVMAEGRMPPGQKLDECTLAKLRRWIETGFPQ
ncbi:MAG: hypothetical protein RMJ66_01620 [Bacteroidia bacterium]|nr:hypothetical protein [Bacteroidia bacterium]